MPLNILHIIWIIFQAIIALILVFPVISYFIYLIAKPRSAKIATATGNYDYAVIVTAYKNSSNLPHVVQSLLKMNYSNFLVYVVADNCPDLINDFEDPKVVTLRPDPVLANQVKSHFLAIDSFKRPHNIVTIIDSDNLVDPNYLTELNKQFDLGYSAVQGVRTAKNFDTVYACIDATNELYYLFYDRKILFNIGSSAMLSGSGMAFTLDLYNTCLRPLDTAGAGFDKILQKEILDRKYRIAFAEDAIVYDEKTSNADQLVKQRARWNNTWFRFFTFGFSLVGKGIRNFSINQFLFGFILLRPPLFILLLMSMLILIANIFISTMAAWIWCGLIFVFSFGFFLALLSSKTDKRIYQSLIHIPKFIFFQILSLLKVRKANQHSVATEHIHNKEIEEIK
ncbi:MAG: glycosyltransferase [Ferruginibacter sp.]